MDSAGSMQPPEGCRDRRSAKLDRGLVALGEVIW